jgi:hypothetical protein
VRRLRTLEVNCFVGERVTVGIEEHVNKKEEVKSNIGAELWMIFFVVFFLK